jgi:hypothetical protein
VVDQLQRQLNGQPATVAHQSPSPLLPGPEPSLQPAALSKVEPAPQPAAPSKLGPPAEQATNQNNDQKVPYYDDSIVLVKTSDESRIPMLLRLWDVTQFRYTNDDRPEHGGPILSPRFYSRDLDRRRVLERAALRGLRWQRPEHINGQHQQDRQAPGNSWQRLVGAAWSIRNRWNTSTRHVRRLSKPPRNL